MAAFSNANTRFTVDLAGWDVGGAEPAAQLPAGAGGSHGGRHRLLTAQFPGGYGRAIRGRRVRTRFGEAVTIGVNRVEANHCATAHAEIVTLSLAQAATERMPHGRPPRRTRYRHESFNDTVRLNTSRSPCFSNGISL